MKNLKIFALILLGIVSTKINALEVINKSSKTAMIYSLGPIPENPKPELILQDNWYYYSKIYVGANSRLDSNSRECQSILQGMAKFTLFGISINENESIYSKIFWYKIVDKFREYLNNKQRIIITIKDDKTAILEIKNIVKFFGNSECVKTCYFDPETQKYQRPLSCVKKSNLKSLIKDPNLETYLLEIAVINCCIVCKKPKESFIKKNKFIEGAGKCKKCNTPIYCSKECQIKDWKAGIPGFEPHKNLCNKIQQSGFNQTQEDSKQKAENSQELEFTDHKDGVAPAVTEQPKKEQTDNQETVLPNKCANCLKEPGENELFKKCGRCCSVRYCSADCQRAHWKSGHKQACIPTSQPAPKEKDGAQGPTVDGLD